MAAIQGQPLANEPARAAVRRRVVVKLREDAATRPPGAGAVEALGAGWRDVAARYPGIAIRPYFREGRVESVQPPGRPLFDERRYHVVEVPEGVAAADVAASLLDTAGVDVAYPEGGPTPPPVNPDDDMLNANQGYLDAAPLGVDARAAWLVVDGSGVGFVDLERGWTLDHEDLAARNIQVLSGLNRDFHGHGTAVLGEIVAVDNDRGIVGLAPGATVHVVSQWRSNDDYSTADAILDAASAMQPGDVLLLEAQTTYPTSGDSFVPVEVEELVFDAIRVATARGIVVVEAGANGAVDLDRFIDVRGRQVLNRSSPDFRDSGAIVVGAASADVPHQRLFFSNFGSRVDCFAWGEHIQTTGDGREGQGRDTYVTDFGGTSGASPIVAGCAVLLQSVRRANRQSPHSPTEIRGLLSDSAVNTPTANPGSDRIGVMPNLQAFIQQPHITLNPRSESATLRG